MSLASGYSTSCGYESPFTFTMNAHNQVASPAGFVYDASGNLTSWGWGSYTYNAESELTSATNVTSVTYTYDGDGNRVEKSNGKLYWYGPDGRVLDETDATGSTTNASFNEYVYFSGGRIARVDSSGNVFYYVADYVGTSRVIAEVPSGSSSASLCYDADFYPYGGEHAYTDTCPQNYKFMGKERDTESNLDDFGARYYSSQLGRFVSADWSSIPIPVPYADLTNPQTLNLYAIVRDNPETYADLDGHKPGVNADSPRGIDGKSFCDEHPSACEQQNDRQQQGQPARAQQQYGRQPNGSYKADPAKVQAAIDKKTPIGNGQCVAACSRLSGVTPHTASWTPGKSVLDLNDTTDVGLAIASFGPNKKFTQPGGDQNSAIYMGHNAAGQIMVVDQWPPPNAKQYNAPFEHPLLNHGEGHNLQTNRMENNAYYYHVIIVPPGE